MKIPKFRTRGTKKSFAKLPKYLAERGFLFFFVLFLVALIIGGLIFYKYVILIEGETPPVEDRTFEFKEANYRTTLKFWEEKSKEFEASNAKQYPDPFRILTQ